MIAGSGTLRFGQVEMASRPLKTALLCRRQSWRRLDESMCISWLLCLEAWSLAVEAGVGPHLPLKSDEGGGKQYSKGKPQALKLQRI